MDERLRDLYAARIKAATQAFAKAHNIKLTGEVLKFDPWTNNLTIDMWVRLEIEDDSSKEESQVI